MVSLLPVPPKHRDVSYHVRLLFRFVLFCFKGEFIEYTESTVCTVLPEEPPARELPNSPPTPGPLLVNPIHF